MKLGNRGWSGQSRIDEEHLPSPSCPRRGSDPGACTHTHDAQALLLPHTYVMNVSKERLPWTAAAQCASLRVHRRAIRPSLLRYVFTLTAASRFYFFPIWATFKTCLFSLILRSKNREAWVNPTPLCYVYLKCTCDALLFLCCQSVWSISRTSVHLDLLCCDDVVFKSSQVKCVCVCVSWGVCFWSAVTCVLCLMVVSYPLAGVGAPLFAFAHLARESLPILIRISWNWMRGIMGLLKKCSADSVTLRCLQAHLLWSLDLLLSHSFKSPQTK